MLSYKRGQRLRQRAALERRRPQILYRAARLFQASARQHQRFADRLAHALALFACLQQKVRGF